MTDRRKAQDLPAVALVAFGLLALAFAQGGYSTDAVASATLAAWVLAVLGIVFAGGLKRASGSALAAAAALLGLAALSALSMAWANDAGRAFAAAVRVAGYAGLFVAVIAWTPRVRPRAWLAGIAIGAAIVTAAALASRFEPSLFGSSDRAASAGIPGAAGRLSYPIGYWNGLAALAALGFTASTWWSVHGAGPRVRALAAGAMPLHLLVIYLASSRGGLGEALAGLALLVWLDRRRAAMLATAATAVIATVVLAVVAHNQHDLLRGLDTSTARSEGWGLAAAAVVAAVVVALAGRAAQAALGSKWTKEAWHPRVVALAGIAAVAAGVFAFAHFGDAGTTASSGSHLLSSSGSGRSQFWGSALDTFEGAPVRGVGAGNWELYWNASPRLPTVVQNAHSLYLETLAELGILGLALLAAFLALAIRAGWRQVAAARPEAPALLGILVAGALAAGIDWTFQLPAVFAPVVVAAGVLVGTPGEAAARGRVWPRVAVFAAAAWVSVWAAGATLLANHYIADSHAAAERGDLAGAAAAARSAAAVEPFAAGPRLQLALVEQAAGSLGAAAKDADHAVRLADLDWQTWFVAAGIARDSGNHPLAARERAVADALSPVALPSR